MDWLRHMVPQGFLLLLVPSETLFLPTLSPFPPDTLIFVLYMYFCSDRSVGVQGRGGMCAGFASAPVQMC